MKIYVSIDDTDNVESRGTGHLAADLCQMIEEKQWGKCDPVTRHQLLLHPDVPYTSHNSSMCFTMEMKNGFLPELTELAQDFLAGNSAPGSDPGLCIVNTETAGLPEELMAFGQQAKKKVLTKDEAYHLAGRLGIHLSEHGGTGGGVIGALAGAGLRMTGNDGRYRGKFKLSAGNGSLPVAELKRQTGVEVVKSLDGEQLPEEEMIGFGNWVKAVLLDGKSTFLVENGNGKTANGPRWHLCGKSEVKKY